MNTFRSKNTKKSNRELNWRQTHHFLKSFHYQPNFIGTESENGNLSIYRAYDVFEYWNNVGIKLIVRVPINDITNSVNVISTLELIDTSPNEHMGLGLRFYDLTQKNDKKMFFDIFKTHSKGLKMKKL